MSLSKDEIKHVSRLAALEVTDEEVDEIKAELDDVLSYVEQLSAVNTEGIEPTSHVHGIVNAFREDVIKDSLSLEEIETFAPDFSPAGFRVPKIIS